MANDDSRQPPDDRALLALVREGRSGRREAQARLFERFQRPVMAFCLSTTRDREQALDLVQEIFERVFRALPGLRDEARFEPWLFSVAANVCRSRGAGESRRRLALTRLALDCETAQAGPEGRDDEERLALVRELIAGIGDPSLRELVEARYVRGEPVAAIAERLGIPLGTVTVKLMRFRAAARKRLLVEMQSSEAA